MTEKVKIVQTDVLYNEKYLLKEIHYDYLKKNGETERKKGQVYNHGNAVTVFLYNKEQRTILLTRQFRMASYVNGNSSGFLVECCAGLLEKETPEEAIKREIAEEMGYKIDEVQKVMELYTSPGVYTEMVHFFTAKYKPGQKAGRGGGLEDEQEEIDIMELPFEEALRMVEKGDIKDAKTVLLLQYARLNQLL